MFLNRLDHPCVIHEMEQNNSYVSCVKIKGISILPPLITSERRKELLEYKKKALALEETYRKKRSQSNISEGKSSKNVDTETTILTSESDQSFPLENALEEVSAKYVPYETRLKENLNLSVDITNVYDCIPVEQIKSNDDECESKLNETIKSLENCPNEICGNDISTKLDDFSRPRLIRSNSYTLDNPSSILLDHLKRQSSSACEQSLSSERNTEVLKSEQKSGKRIGPKPIIYDSENVQNQQANISHKIDNIEKYKNSQPSVEVITTDITVHQINFTSSDINNRESDRTLSVSEITEPKSIREEEELSTSTDPEIELNAILQQIPENYAKKIMQLVKEQKNEQQKRTQNYEYLKTEMLQSGDFENKTSIQVSSPKRIFVTSASNPQPNLTRNDVIENKSRKDSDRPESFDINSKSMSSSLNESETLPFDMSTSGSNSLDDFSLRTIRMLDVERKSNGEIDNCQIQMNRLFPKETMSNYELNKLKEREMQRIREEKAACIIGAYAKGYLVRRLMNTAKVKTIIQTIQDALVCALELQGSETIQEADVELHRRLIKLVSSACYEFHDIFFALTIPEQMDIIAIDREKIKKTVAVRTTHSSTDFHSRRRTSSNQSNIRSSQSLTRI